MAYSEKQIEELFEEVILRITEGEAIRTILKDSHMPSNKVFYKWLDSDEEKGKQYARACNIRADSVFEEILEIADDSSGDTYFDKDGNPKLDSEFVQRSRLKIDARKWYVSKLNPKKYGDRVMNENVNKNFDLNNLTDEEIEERLRQAKKVIGE